MTYRFIDDEAGLEELLDELADEPLYGLDTEFHRERTYYPQLALVQIAGPHGASLIDPLAVSIRPLARLLDGPGTCVVHAASQDLEILQRETGTLPSHLFDPQIAGAFLGLGNASLGLLTRELLGVQLDKSVQLADWLHRPLRSRELDYAASDVLHLLDLHRVLTERLEALGRLPWAEEESERMRRKDRTMRPPETAWWRLKGKGKLSGKARGVAQCVAAWRERRAAALDRLPRMVLPDMVLLSIAGRPPRDLRQLRKVRGMEGRFLANGADEEILEAIEEGLRLPPQAHVVPPRGSHDFQAHGAVSLAMAWLAQVAEDAKIDLPAIATRDEVQSFVSGKGDSRLRDGWRLELVGKDIEDLVAGRKALAWEEGRRLVLTPR